jgi:hypothetical protein
MAGASRVSYETGRAPFKPQTVLLRVEASAVAKPDSGTSQTLVGVRSRTRRRSRPRFRVSGVVEAWSIEPSTNCIPRTRD